MLEYLLSTRAYWAGQYVDLWSIPHMLFGAMVATGAALAGIGTFFAFAGTFEAALLWEIFERISGVGASETWMNSTMDIVCALVGFTLGVLLIRKVKNEDARRMLLALMTAVWALVNFLGWLAYRHYAGAAP